MKATNRPIPLKPVRKRQHGAMPKSIEEKILDGTLDIWEERDRLIKQRLERGVLIERKLPTCENKPPDSCEPEVYTRRIETYAKRVVSGEAVANRLVKLACERHLKDLERSRTDPKYPYFFELRENNICEFAEQQVHIKGSWARETEPGRIPFIVLEDWQVFMLGVLFGWRKRQTDLRRFRELYAEIPRKNGKSIAGAIIGLYMAFADDEVGAEAYAGAGSLAQAMQVFKPAYLMIRRNPWIRERYDLGVSGTDQNPSRIFQYATGSMFEPVIGKPGDGPSPHCAIIDEYHEHASPDLYDTMKTGAGARRQPLRIVITTAGVNTSGPCYEKHLEAIKMLEGTYENDELFALIFTLDDDDDWEDFEVWKKVNPNFNVSVFEDYLKSQHRDAINKLSDRNINRTKHLNQWLNAGVGWMDMIKWQTCCDASMTLDQFAGQECWLAVDAANKVDIMALAILFRLKTGGFAFFSKNYLCKETIDKPENSHYRLWRDAGWLIEAGSARTDHRLIHDDIKALSSRFAIQQLAYDPRESNYLISTIEEWASFACVEIQQGHALMSEPMKEMEALIYSGALRHADDPCLTWQMSNVVKKQGSAGVVKYYYPSKERDANKIDAIVAGIMALGRAMVNERTKEPEFQAMFF